MPAQLLRPPKVVGQADEITVSATKGETKVETKGFSGNDCQAATRCLEIALGARDSESLTSEFYQQARSELEQNAKQ